MRKLFSMMVALAAVFTFAACETTPEEPTPSKGTKIATPQVEITDVVEDGFTVKWGAVENAKSYSVVLSKANSSKTETKNVTETSVAFSGLGVGTYTVSVKAIANDGYKDSDYAKATAAVEGATSADWFELSVFVTNEYEAQGYYSYNSLFYTMKGTNVASVSVMITTAEIAASYTTDEILSKLQPVGADGISKINTAEGPFSAVDGCPSNTELVFYALAENADGASVFTHKTATTTEFVVPENVKSWIGTYEATLEKYYVYADDANNPEYYEDTTDKFEFVVGFDEQLGLYVDGFSVQGGGWETAASITEDGKLGIYSGIQLGQDQQGYTYAWLTMANLYQNTEEGFVPVEGEQGKFYAEEWASHFLVKEGDSYACNAAAYDMGDGTVMEIVFNDIFALKDNKLYFLIDAWPAKYRAGNFAVVKTSDEVKDLAPEQASVKSYEFMNTMPTSYSVVY
jgi:hypothetical protein